MFQQLIMNNAVLGVEIDAYLKSNNFTRVTFGDFCKNKNTCIGIFTKIKTEPFYFNKTGKKLSYLFLDIDTKKAHTIKINDKFVVKNVEENKIKW